MEGRVGDGGLAMSENGGYLGVEEVGTGPRGHLQRVRRGLVVRVKVEVTMR